MDEDSNLHKEKAFQEKEQILTELFIDEELVTTLLNRAYLSSNKVEANFVSNLDNSEDDDRFINDDEIEDNTLIDYCDSEKDL